MLAKQGVAAPAKWPLTGGAQLLWEPMQDFIHRGTLPGCLEMSVLLTGKKSTDVWGKCTERAPRRGA